MVKMGQLTLNGAAQNLLTAFTAASPTTLAGAQANLHLRQLFLQTEGANPVYVGDSNLVSTTVYGRRLNGAVATVPPDAIPFGPFTQGAVNFADFWVFGTSNDVLHIFGVPF